MRALPIEPIGGSPSFVTGIALVRGRPTPVVDLVRLSIPAAPTGSDYRRFVTIRSGERVVALAVDDVVGVMSISSNTLGELPPLLAEAADGAIASSGPSTPS